MKIALNIYSNCHGRMKYLFPLIFTITSLAGCSKKQIYLTDTSGIIATVVGNGNGAGYGSGAYGGDGGPADSAELEFPTDVAIDASGNMYISDMNNNRIRKVNSSGIITTIAGTGIEGFSGDGGPAISAELNNPSRIELDNKGNMYITDGGNSVIRKINSSGIISTIADNETAGYSGDGGPATLAQLYGGGITVDNNSNLYIADFSNNVIRKVNSLGIITTIAGNGFGAGTGNGGYTGDGGSAILAELNGPAGIAIDASGNIYVGDMYNNVVRKINSSGIISTIAGNGYGANTLRGGFGGDGGPATLAYLSNPNGVTIDGNRNIYIADSYNQRIREVNTKGVIATIAGNGYIAGPAPDFDGGYNGDGMHADSAELNLPCGIAVDGLGNTYIADEFNDRIRKVK